MYSQFGQQIPVCEHINRQITRLKNTSWKLKYSPIICQQIIEPSQVITEQYFPLLMEFSTPDNSAYLYLPSKQLFSLLW